MKILLFAAALLSASVCGKAEEMKTVSASINIKPDRKIGVINPCIYGHFSEHIGGVIYDGVWVGKDSKVPNIDGIRKDIVDYMKRIDPPVIRWPGGCFADGYHWRDGIGPADNRPRRYGRWKDATESNQFGTHEFIRFCRLVGAEPCFAGNVGTGAAQEFQEWIEYCNAPADRTNLAELRETNGSHEPFNVKYWGVGNEAWGCGGNFTAEDYCAEYRKFTTSLPKYGTDLFFIASGPHDNDIQWTKRFFTKLSDVVGDWGKPPVHGWSPHYYCGASGGAVDFTDDQWYDLIAKAAEMEKLVIDQWQALGEFDPKHEIKLIIDEWGAWHPGGTEINPAHTLEQMSTLRDAMIAAVTLDIFNRHCDKVAMSNVAQLVNNLHSLFLADGPKFIATPNFYVFEMYKVHQGGTAVEMNIDSPQSDYSTPGGKRKFGMLHGSASVKGKKLNFSVTNTSIHDSVEANINFGELKVSGGKVTILANKDIHAHNTFEDPKEVVSKSSPLKVSGDNFKHTFTPASITVFELDMQ